MKGLREGLGKLTFKDGRWAWLSYSNLYCSTGLLSNRDQRCVSTCICRVNYKLIWFSALRCCKKTLLAATINALLEVNTARAFPKMRLLSPEILFRCSLSRYSY